VTDRSLRTGIYELDQEPELPDLFRVALRNQSLRTRTHTVARVVTYDPATQRVTVTVEVPQVIKDHVTPATPAKPNPVKTQDPVVLQSIPVAWPSTGTGYITFPLVPGDTGELHIQDRSLKLWLETGLPRDPVTAWTHSLADAVFHPGLRATPAPITPPTSLTATVVEGPLVNLGALANQPVLKGTLVAQAFTTYCTTVATAYAAWLLVVPPTAVSNGAFINALGGANASLLTSITSWPSLKVFTE
jgi:hypothetical protein